MEVLISERFNVPPEAWTAVQEASDELLEKLVADGSFTDETLTDARLLLDRLAAAGHVTRAAEPRRLLRSKLAYWASEIRFETSTVVHPPRLLPAGKGSGLPVITADEFVGCLEAGERVNNKEVQGGGFHGDDAAHSAVQVLNSFCFRCSLRNLYIAGELTLAKTSFLGGDVTDVEATRFEAPHARFLATQFRDLRVATTSIFRACRMPFSHVDGGELRGANFDFANLAGGEDMDARDTGQLDDYGVKRDGTGGTRFTRVDLSGATFRGECRLRGTVFDNCNLRGASFVGSNLAGTTFRDCDFVGDEFNGALDAAFASVTDSRSDRRSPDPRAFGAERDDRLAR